MRRFVREPMNAISHGVGALLGLAGLVWLLREAGIRNWEFSPWPLAVFGVSLILLYVSSTLYHGLHVSDRVIAHLRRVDHMMIYVFIAGTYTPICLLVLKGTLGLGLCVAVWCIAVAGMVLKVGWMHAPRWLHLATYLGMGWVAVLVLPAVIDASTLRPLVWLGIGGAFYTVGAAIYGFKRPHFSWIGFHEIWHLFVLAGTFSHFWAVHAYVVA